MSIQQCLNCRRSLEPADREHRYCPYCGTVRVIADPPGIGPQGPAVVLGVDVIGPQTGIMYGYERLDAPPRALEPLAGAGLAARDLLASSHTPFPETAFYTLAGPLDSRNGSARRIESGSAIQDIACRHTRLYCVVEGGQLWAYDTRSLNHPNSWTFPRLPAEGRSTRLQVAESLVFCTILAQGSTTVLGYELGTGKLRLQQSLPYRNCRVLIAGGELLVVACDQPGVLRLERYDLGRFGSALSVAEPDQRQELAVGEPVGEELTAPLRLGRDFLIVTPEHRLVRWGPDPYEPPQVLWPNPRGARLCEPLFLGPRAVGFVTEAPEGRRSLVRLELDAEGRSAFGSAVDLPVLAQSRGRAAAAFGDTVYLCAHPPGGPIQLYSQRENQEARLFATLDGTREAEVHGLQALPWKGELRLLLDYSPSPKALHREFYLVHPMTGMREKLDWSPLREADVRVLWETGRAWRVELSRGLIQVEA